MLSQIAEGRLGWWKANFSKEELAIEQEMGKYVGSWERWEHNLGSVNVNTYHGDGIIIAARYNTDPSSMKTFQSADEETLAEALDWVENKTY